MRCALLGGRVRRAFVEHLFDVDFQRDIRRGDTFGLLFDEYSDDNGRVVKSGDILLAEMVLSGKPMRLYRYKTHDGRVDYVAFTKAVQGEKKTLISELKDCDDQLEQIELEKKVEAWRPAETCCFKLDLCAPLPSSCSASSLACSHRLAPWMGPAGQTISPPA